MRDRRSVVRSTKALHEVRHEVRGPDAYMGFLHEVYAWKVASKCAFLETGKTMEHSSPHREICSPYFS